LTKIYGGASMEAMTYKTPMRFGMVTRVCHWLIFILVIMQYTLVYRRDFLADTDPWKLQMILLHKSFGVIILGLGSLMLIMRVFKGRPPYLAYRGVNPTIQRLQNSLAKIVHVLLYLSLILMPLAGILMSLYGGRGVAVFNYPLLSPNLITPNKAIGSLFYNTHVITSYILLALIVLHILGALYHKWILKDQVFDRMA
jgi:cytochrome b561